jgi:hypothetical protein
MINETYGATGNYNNYVLREWQNFFNVSGQEPSPLNGVLKCFCDEQKTLGASLSTLTLGEIPVCKQYNTDLGYAFIANNIVKYMIIAINFVLRLFIIKLIIYIGMDTESEQTRLICNGVFVV